MYIINLEDKIFTKLVCNKLSFHYATLWAKSFLRRYINIVRSRPELSTLVTFVLFVDLWYRLFIFISSTPKCSFFFSSTYFYLTYLYHAHLSGKKKM